MSRCVHPRGDFNSRPSARGDSPRKAGETFRLDFNSRPSARGDIHSSNPKADTGNFNSRPSARGDGRDENAFSPPDFISIHAPPRGATFPRSSRWWTLRHFNSRPSARGDYKALTTYSPTTFQFTPLREGRLEGAELSAVISISIHAPPRGATPRFRCSTTCCLFQFTPLREGRQKRLCR